MTSGPARLEELQRTVQTLSEQLGVLHDRQDAELAELRASVANVLDDVTARLAALDGDHSDRS